MGINAVSAKLKDFFAKNKREVYIVGTDIFDDVRCTCICATTKHFSSIEDFMDTLDCLFALQRIRYDAEREVLCYVA